MSDERPMLFVGFHSDGVVETCSVQPCAPSDVTYVAHSDLKDSEAKAEVLSISRREWKEKCATAERELARYVKYREEDKHNELRITWILTQLGESGDPAWTVNNFIKGRTDDEVLDDVDKYCHMNAYEPKYDEHGVGIDEEDDA